MTLQGKKNHYNVKLLHGYGVSISLKDSRLVLTNGKDILTGSQEKEEWFITNLPYEKIVVSGKGYVSFEALKLLNQNNRNVVLVDTFGKPVSLMNGLMDSMTGTRYRMGQYDTFRDPAKCRHLTRQFLKAKIESQIRFLKSLFRDDAASTIKSLQSYLQELESSSEYFKIESKAGNVYFRFYRTMFDPRHRFESRNNSSLRITKRRASDPINALLNYGYAVLAGEVSKFVCGIGLDPYLGFNHRSHTGFQPLVYDIIEPFRWLVEYSVYKFANQHAGKRIRMKDYAFTREGRVVLDSSLIQRFLEILERKFQSERPYKFKHGMKGKDGMSKCQEITIAKIQAQNLATYCLGKENEFIP